MTRTVVVLRFPFDRNGFINPQNINWNQDKQQKLWNYVTQIKNSGNSIDMIDWKHLSTLLKVDLQFLQKQVYHLYEKELLFIKNQLNDKENLSKLDQPLRIDTVLKKNVAINEIVNRAIADLDLEDIEDTISYGESIHTNVPPSPSALSEFEDEVGNEIINNGSVHLESLKSVHNDAIRENDDTLKFIDKKHSSVENSSMLKQLSTVSIPTKLQTTNKQTQFHSTRSYFQGNQSIVNKLKPTTTTTNLHILTKPIPTTALPQVAPFHEKKSNDIIFRNEHLNRNIEPLEMRRSSSVVTVSLPSYIKDQIRLESNNNANKGVYDRAINESPFMTDEDSISGDSLENVAIRSQSLYHSNFNSNDHSMVDQFGDHNVPIDDDSDDDDYLFNNSTIKMFKEHNGSGALTRTSNSTSNSNTNSVSYSNYRPLPFASKNIQPITSETNILKRKSFKQTVLTNAYNESSTNLVNAESMSNERNSNDVSSFSDLSTASISKSALEKVLMENIYS